MPRFLLQGARFATRLTVQKPARLSPTCLIRPSQPIARPIPRISARFYAAGGGLSKSEVEGRIIDLLKGYDKVKDQSKVTSASNFANDLGLDSLDAVEVVMGVEEEFNIEIPDKEADAIQSVDGAVNYILSQPDAA